MMIIKINLTLVIILIIISCVPCNQHNPTDLISTYNSLLTLSDGGDSLLYNDNLEGRIVWNECYFMLSLLNMYQATKQEKYLDIFCKHADHILTVRDDNANITDYLGRVRPGWQTGSYYTLGVPKVIPDNGGLPSLIIRGIHMDSNNYIEIQIQSEEKEQFSIRVYNDFRRNTTLVRKYDNLTLDNIEKTINTNNTPNHWINVHVIGESQPKEGVYKLDRTYNLVLHELHTPNIGIPFLKFSEIVLRSPNLSQYHPKALGYLHEFEKSALDYRDSYIVDKEGGYFIFENKTELWASGLPLPINGQSSNGHFYLLLYKLSGNTSYYNLTENLAHKIRAQMVFFNNGTMKMNYWIKDNSNYTPPPDGIYSSYPAFTRIEDISHFACTLRFMLESKNMGLFFVDDDIKSVTKTFSDKILPTLSAPEHNKKSVPKYMDGTGSVNSSSIFDYISLSSWDSSILERSQRIYSQYYINLENIDMDYSYGPVMLGWSNLAREKALSM